MNIKDVERLWITVLLIALMVPACHVHALLGYWVAERLPDGFVPQDPWTLYEAGIRFGEMLNGTGVESYEVIIVDEVKAAYWADAPPMLVYNGKYYSMYWEDLGFDTPIFRGYGTAAVGISVGVVLAIVGVYFFWKRGREKEGVSK